MIELIDNMKTMDSEMFEKLYGRLDVDHQIEVDKRFGSSPTTL